MLNIPASNVLVAAAVALVLSVSPPASAKTKVSIKNCSNIYSLTYKAYNPWKENHKMVYQYGRGLAQHVNYFDTDYVECASKNWFRKWDSCYVRIEKYAVVDVTHLLKGGTYSFHGGNNINPGITC